MQLYKIRRHNGFLLPILLIWIQVMFLFTIYALTLTVTHAKIVRQEWNRQQFLNTFDGLLKEREKDILTELPPCLIAPMSTEEIQQASFDWWQATSCIGKVGAIQYYYVVERLGEDNCARVGNVLQDKVASYYRVSLLGIEAQNGFKILVRSTLVKSIVMTDKCNQSVHVVEEGRQSLWKL